VLAVIIQPAQGRSHAALPGLGAMLGPARGDDQGSVVLAHHHEGQGGPRGEWLFACNSCSAKLTGQEEEERVGALVHASV